MNFYEEKKQRRIEKYQELELKNNNESETRFKKAREMGSIIPFGQPILVGHHSEKKHRSHISKIDSNYSKGFEAMHKAEHYAEKAAAAEENNNIMSTDSDAIKKLQAKIDYLQKSQDTMKAVNKIIKKHMKKKTSPHDDLSNLKISNESILRLLKADCFGGIGYASYSLTNNNATIRAAKKRLEALTKMHERKEINIKLDNGIEILEANQQIQVHFVGKPSQEIRDIIKRHPHSLKWSSYSIAWVRKLTPSINNRYINSLVEYLKTIKEGV